MHLPKKNAFQAFDQNCLPIAEVNHVMHPENERISCHFFQDNFNPSGSGRARTILNAAGRTWD